MIIAIVIAMKIIMIIISFQKKGNTEKRVKRVYVPSKTRIRFVLLPALLDPGTGAIKIMPDDGHYAFCGCKKMKKKKKKIQIYNRSDENALHERDL
jgi:hypothetical protein